MSVRSVSTMLRMWNVHSARLTMVTSAANTTRMRMMSWLTIMRVARTLLASIAAATGVPACASARSRRERTARGSAPASTRTAYSVMRDSGWSRSSWAKRAAGALNARICDPALPNSISSTTPAMRNDSSWPPIRSSIRSPGANCPNCAVYCAMVRSPPPAAVASTRVWLSVRGASASVIIVRMAKSVPRKSWICASMSSTAWGSIVPTPAVPLINSHTSAVAAARGTTMSTSAVCSSSASAV